MLILVENDSVVDFKFVKNCLFKRHLKQSRLILLFDMSDPIEEEVIKKLVLDDLMRCRACNVTAVNLPTWESHKKGKR